MTPHFKGFRGEIKKTKEHTWQLTGLVIKEGSQLHVTELPPGRWIQDFKEHLDDLVDKGMIQKYENHSTETTPDFRIWGYGGDDPIKDLGLTRSVQTSNMYLIAANGAVKKYNSPEEILLDYIEIRLGLYKKRKAWLLKEFDSEIEWLSEKARFIMGVLTGHLKVLNVPLVQVQNQLASAEFKNEIWEKLLDIKTYQYVAEEVQKLRDLVARRKAERDALKATSVVQMWKNNLSEL
jgi:DNA topoisomerase-2